MSGSSRRRSVQAGGTLELSPGISIVDEKLTISGDDVDGMGAQCTDDTFSNCSRFGSSSSSDGSTIFLNGDASIGVGIAGNQMLVGQIQGTGNLVKLGARKLNIEKASTFAGDLIVLEGKVTGRSGVVNHRLFVSPGASIAGIGGNALDTTDDVDLDGTLDLNARTDDNALSQEIGKLHGTGTVISSNPFSGSGGILDIASDSGVAEFSGTISTHVSIVKSGLNTQTFSGSMNHTGTTLIAAGTLLVNGTHTGGDSYTVLGSDGSINADITTEAGGTLTLGTSVGQQNVEHIVFKTGSTLEIEIGGLAADNEHDQLLADSITLAGDLAVSLLDLGSGPFIPDPSDSFMIVDATKLTGIFDNVATGERLDTTGGEGSFIVTYDGISDAILLSDFALSSSPGDFDGDGNVDGNDFLTFKAMECRAMSSVFGKTTTDRWNARECCSCA